MDIKEVKCPKDRDHVEVKYENARPNGDVEKLGVNWPDPPAPRLVVAFNRLRLVIVEECHLPQEISDAIYIEKVVFKHTELGQTVELQALISHRDMALPEYKIQVEPLLIARITDMGKVVHDFRNEVYRYLKGHKLQIGLFDAPEKQVIKIEVRPGDSEKALDITKKRLEIAKGKTKKKLGEPKGEPITNGKAKTEVPPKQKYPKNVGSKRSTAKIVDMPK